MSSRRVSARLRNKRTAGPHNSKESSAGLEQPARNGVAARKKAKLVDRESEQEDDDAPEAISSTVAKEHALRRRKDEATAGQRAAGASKARRKRLVEGRQEAARLLASEIDNELLPDDVIKQAQQEKMELERMKEAREAQGEPQIIMAKKCKPKARRIIPNVPVKRQDFLLSLLEPEHLRVLPGDIFSQTVAKAPRLKLNLEVLLAMGAGGDAGHGTIPETVLKFQRTHFRGRRLRRTRTDLA